MSANVHPLLDLSAKGSVQLPESPFQGPMAWTRNDLSARDWTLTLDAAALDELHRLVAALRKDPLPTLLLDPEAHNLPACQEVMARVRTLLDSGIGVCVVNRRPLDEWSQEEAQSAYWVLGAMVGRMVAQKWDGTMLYDVTDTGRTFGPGVRASWTNVELFFHTDNAFGTVIPDIVSLMCFNPATEGGVSRFCSLYSVFNRMQADYPRLSPRLFEPFYFDRQAEHAPDAPPVCLAPMFAWDGQRLNVRLSVGLARRGYDLAGVQMDGITAEALEALETVLADESLWIEFRIERGQLQFLNNTGFGHFRSNFTDDPATPRHLVRLWYRALGHRSYEG